MLIPDFKPLALLVLEKNPFEYFPVYFTVNQGLSLGPAFNKLGKELIGNATYQMSIKPQVGLVLKKKSFE